jgi:hypothetical protein
VRVRLNADLENSSDSVSKKVSLIFRDKNFRSAELKRIETGPNTRVGRRPIRPSILLLTSLKQTQPCIDEIVSESSNSSPWGPLESYLTVVPRLDPAEHRFDSLAVYQNSLAARTFRAVQRS